MKSSIKDEKIKELEKDLKHAKLDIKKLHRHIYIQSQELSRVHALNLVSLKQKIKTKLWARIKKTLAPFPMADDFISRMKTLYDDTKKQTPLTPLEHWIQEDLRQCNTSNAKRLIFISPLPPSKSGIANYSMSLLNYLKSFYDITLVCENEEVQNNPLIKEFKTILADEYMQCGIVTDRHLYHFGNSVYHLWMEPLLERYPGTLVLHDIFLGGYTRMKFQNEVETAVVHKIFEEEGYKAIVSYMETDLHHALLKYPMNKTLIEKSDSIIVHSSFAKSLLSEPQAKIYQIPHLKALPTDLMTQAQARKILGIEEESFLIASFGFIGPSKCSHELAKAWKQLASFLPSHVKLVFVGNVPPSSYGETLKTLTNDTRTIFTDYCDDEAFIHYLLASDVVVQLRKDSRGETSGALLYALAYGKPTMINAHGSFCEIPNEVALCISEHFSVDELSQTIKTLYENEALRKKLTFEAQRYIAHEYDPNQCAKMYHDAIEESYEQGTFSPYRKALLKPQSQYDKLINLRTQKPQKSVYIDVSDVAHHDLKTGIQRVVRSILHYLLNDESLSHHIKPVRLVEGRYVHAHEFTCQFLGLPFSPLVKETIELKKGDLFLGLDHYIAKIGEHPEIFEEMAKKGVKIWFVMYDLLPVLFPHFFPPTSEPMFRKWLHVITSYAQGVLCISASVANDFSLWLNQERIERSIAVETFPLGADIDNSHPTKGISQAQAQMLSTLSHPYITLMVGTVEPRKGHAYALSAYEHLWAQEENIALVIVGKKGWMVEALAKRIYSHPLYGKTLFWFEHASDELLEQLYAKATFLLAASEAEGYGLPLIEAAKHALPIIARDIPVFKEVAGEQAHYFPNVNEPASLADEITNWLQNYKENKHPHAQPLKITQWKESTEALWAILKPDF